jgi:hypothetical protein
VERSNRVTSQSAQERRVWELLTRDFHWSVPTHHPVRICDHTDQFPGSVRLQIFEMAVTTILAHMRPEFAWCVTPNLHDNGLDFIGVHRFLDDRELGIAAAITVGGQCKKRTSVNDVLSEIAGSLIRMADAVNPTFFVVALSARLTRQRVEKARGMLERQCQRHCHILDRAQIEGLLGEYLSAVAEILRAGLSEPEVDEVLRYFAEREAVAPAPSVTVRPPGRVLAGVPFLAEVDVRWALASNPTARMWWRPRTDDDGAGSVTLIGPLDADSNLGVELTASAPENDPLRSSLTIELITYRVGRVDLGDVFIGLDEAGQKSAHSVALGAVEVVETMRPRFFARPYRSGVARLSDAFHQVEAGAVVPVAVVGVGGSGKSRLCEEFALERRRRGCGVVAAKQTKTHDAPHRIFADLLAQLTADGPTLLDPAESAIRSVSHYDRELAARAASTIRSVFGTSDPPTGNATDQSLLSTLVLLLVARARRCPLIVHLQDLHWCNADVLLLVERLVWQLTQTNLAGPGGRHPAGSGVLFLFEGRVHESGDSGSGAWSSAPFEAFLERVDSTMVTCSSFSQDDGLSFTRLLFEDRHNANRLVADELLALQRELIDRVHRSSGGNPFHTLEQVRLLKERGVLGQNRNTGLLYMILPEPVASTLPQSIFTAVQLRWQYLRDRAPTLALLLWASALLEDQLPVGLFRRLWQELAPDVSLRDIDGTDILWTGDGTAQDVVFRHENYFESLRRFTVPETDRRQVVNVYCEWFAQLRRPGPADRFRWARALLELPDPDIKRARELLVTALKGSQRQGDVRLARRILAFHLDLTWTIDERSAVPIGTFLRHCDDEIDLCRELLGIDRGQTAARIRHLRERLDARLRIAGDRMSTIVRDGLDRRHLATELMHAQVLFNDRRPTESAEIATRIVSRVRAHNRYAPADVGWESLEMEALYTQSCGQALSGQFDLAVQSSEAAAEIARNSPSPLARKIVSTCGTMLLSEDPEAGERLLRDCETRWPEDDSSDAFLVHVHLSMALVLQAYRLPLSAERRRTMLVEARERTTSVHDACRRLGLYADAGAAALVRGVVSALLDEGDEASWFAQGVAAAARGMQMETLWRSHVNLATALCRKDGIVTQGAHDHAVAAVEIMQDTLAAYSEPDRSPRFELLRVGLARVAWMLLATGDEAGLAVLERYPRLRADFRDPEAGMLREYEGEPRHYQWLRVGDVDYVLY